ncbi:MAG: hypothetical protein ABIK73_06785 [candidate division WOR-3 bacterium]
MDIKTTLEQKISEYIKNTKRNYPVHSNRASELGHPCLRYLVYCRTRWEDRLMPSDELQVVFNEGRIHERAVIELLNNAGIPVVEQQSTQFWREFNLSGSIDGKILLDGRAIPIEIKSVSPYTFEKINDVDDLFLAKQYYLRKYPTQMLIYLLLNNTDYGILILKNKASGQIKFIEIYLNSYLEVAEEAIKKCELVEKHIKGNTLPDQINDYDVCGDCSFFHICMPNIDLQELQFVSDKELEEKLERREELSKYVKEYNELDVEIKERFRGKGNFNVGEFLIQNIKRTRKEYLVPAGEYFEVRIKKLAPQTKNQKGRED